MKGMVFTEFLEMVEEKFDYETVDEILSKEELASGGIYSSVGTYSHKEMFVLVQNLHEKSGIPIGNLLEVFGEYLFGSLYKAYGSMFQDLSSAFDMINSIEGYIHVEVRKLYPDAELPTFETISRDDKVLVIDYTSERRMSDLAVGLMRGCFKEFGEEIGIQKAEVAGRPDTVRFTLTKV
jgi:hypothetical protein